MGDVFYGLRLTRHEYDEKVFSNLQKFVWNCEKIVVYGIVGDIEEKLSYIKKEHNNCILYFSDNLKTNFVYKLS